MGNRLELRAERSILRGGIELYFLAPAHTQGSVLVGSVKYEEQSEHCSAEPTVLLKNSEAQQLVDELWACGIRPTDGAGSAGAMAATENHLADMKQIAFGLLKKQGVCV